MEKEEVEQTCLEITYAAHIDLTYKELHIKILTTTNRNKGVR